jgi:putative ABC transport system permease protein
MKNIVKIALRSLRKNILSSVLIGLGLSIAYAACLLILSYINHEYSHDKFHKNRSDIYKLVYSTKWANNEYKDMHLHDFKLVDRLKSDVPQITNACAYRKAWGAISKYREDTFDDILGIADPEFLNMFSYPLMAGNPEKALQTPGEVVISKRFAEKIMDKEAGGYNQLLGETLEFLNIPDVPFRITGIMEEPPTPSSIKFDLLIDYHYQKYFGQSYECFGNSIVFVELTAGSDLSTVKETTERVIKSYYEEKINRFKAQGEITDTRDFVQAGLKNVSDLHFQDNINNGYLSLGSRPKMNILAIIGLIILLTACCNFLLFSYGQTRRKVHYVGVMKVFGASRSQIMKLVWVEAYILHIVSILTGLIISIILLPVFEQYTQIELTTPPIGRMLIPVIIIVSLFSSILAALPYYFFFKESNPVLLLKKQIVKRDKNIASNAFIIFQYLISSILVIGTIVVYKQTDFLKTGSMGFDPGNVIELSLPSDFRDQKTNTLKDRLLDIPGVISVGGNDKGFLGNTSTYHVKNSKGDLHEVRLIRVDEGFMNSMGIPILEGEDFTPQNITRTNDEVIVNEKFLAVMGIGQALGTEADIVSLGKVRIKGVVKDFHFDTMRDEIQPLIMIPNTDYEVIRWLYIKHDANSAPLILAEIEKAWDEIAPGRELKYTFLVDQLTSRYDEEERWGEIVTYASLLAILISSLGLFGLSLITVNKKIKEISIRKVNGATIRDIVLLLNKGFIFKIGAGIIFACPLAYIIMTKWLANYANRISIYPWIFGLAGLIIITVALLTINWQCWKSARKNPTDTLRAD